jgi:hypothetical protein
MNSGRVGRHALWLHNSTRPFLVGEIRLHPSSLEQEAQQSRTSRLTFGPGLLSLNPAAKGSA